MESYMETHSPSNSGLLRFRSAPSSVFSDYTHNNSWSDSDKFGSEELSETYEKKPRRLNNSSCQNGYSGQLPPQYPKQSNSFGTGSGLSLDRQSSLPSSGFFNHHHLNNSNPQNEKDASVVRIFNSYSAHAKLVLEFLLIRFSVYEGRTQDFVLVQIRARKILSYPNLSYFISGYAVIRGHLPLIPEIANENGKEMSPAGFQLPCWNESNSDLPDNGGIISSRPHMLSHHLSLPKTSTEMAVIEKLLHFQDAVPCKVRAKRGCATHPRSIAERVRRNRISERMRKLQDLVPNMDKQTNTADMLDLAVDYIKNLQNEFKALSDNRAKCKCPHLRH